MTKYIFLWAVMLSLLLDRAVVLSAAKTFSHNSDATDTNDKFIAIITTTIKHYLTMFILCAKFNLQNSKSGPCIHNPVYIATAITSFGYI